MTTVAYRDGILAGDTAMGTDGSLLGYGQKIFKHKKGWLLGFSGNAQYCHLAKDWFMKCSSVSELLEPWPEGMRGDDAVNLIFVLDKKTIIRFEGKKAYEVLLPKKSPFYAIGTGREVALGAFEAGATAKQAVRAAKRWDHATGGKIQTLKLGVE